MKRCLTLLALCLCFGCDKQPYIITNMRGGLIDQMDYFLIGEQLKKKGIDVKFDISYYNVPGGRFSSSIKKSYNRRSFQLLKAFPYLKTKLHIASDGDVKLLKSKNVIRKSKEDGSNSWSFFKEVVDTPVYIDMWNLGNWSLCQDIVYPKNPKASAKNSTNLYKEYFHFKDISIMDEENMAVLNKIKLENNSVGVHVRRGDFVELGDVLPEEYFLLAAKKAKELWPDCCLFFFSDEPEYVKEYIFPELDSNIRKEIVDINDADHCYRDLFLMSECKYQIAGLGSMIYVAFFINNNPEKKLIAPRSGRNAAYRKGVADIIML
ncbi:MAG: alpha-1,2-fucosyltransferase [Endomicrobium sp.]|nr:alpha-1,2-fucosyltransferase [Endomicrobium sp.]